MKLTMTIRRKLFLGFLAVVAAPLIMVIALSHAYVQRTRTDLDQRFLEQARLAFRRLNDRTESNLDLLKTVVHELAVTARPGEESSDVNVSMPSMSFKVQTSTKHTADDDSTDVVLFSPSFGSDDGKSHKMVITTRTRHSADGEAKKPAKKKRRKTALLDPFGAHAAKFGKDEDEDTDLLVPDVKSTMEESVADPEIDVSRMQVAAARIRQEHPAIVGLSVRVNSADVMNEGDVDFDHELWNLPPGAIVAGPESATHASLWTTKRGDFIVDRLRGDSKGEVAAKVDPRSILDVAQIYRRGRAFYLDPKSKAAWHCPSGSAHVTSVLPLAALAARLPENGAMTTVVIGAERFRIYAALPNEQGLFAGTLPARLVAVVPEGEIYAPLLWFQLEQIFGVGFSMLLAVWLSYFLSGRFVGSVENIQRGVDALSRGDFSGLEKSSGDELGSGLVESMNRMATVLKERTRKEEVEGWRRLVRVLSHEINNTLGPVRSVAVTVRDQITPRLAVDENSEDLQMAFRLIVDRVDSLSNFIAGYAELAKLPEPARVHSDLNDIVHAAVGMLQPSADRAGVSIIESYAPEARALLDGGQLERVAINLIKNAVEAAKSKVVVSTVRYTTGIELTVEDDGPGIAAEAMRMLFVPYFTTKPGGSGIGLALARQIALGHGGSIVAEDRPGGGALLRVTLPAAGDAN